MKKGYNKSFEARLILANETCKNYYKELKIKLLSLDKVNERISWNLDSYSFKRKKIAVLRIVNNKVYVYLDLNYVDYENQRIKLFDVSNRKKYQKTPLLLKVKGANSFKLAVKMIDDLADKYRLNHTFYFLDEEDFIYRYLTRPIDILVRENLVKEVWYKNNFFNQEENTEELVKVKFSIKLMKNFNINNLYLVGNIDKLGNWNFENAIKLKKVNDQNYTTTLKLPKTKIEFKIACGKDWRYVEKGIWNEDIINHHYDLYEDLEVEDLIYNFNMEEKFDD